ncbi:MAG: CIA30 family protein [Cyclobacteriaceae bacterium]
MNKAISLFDSASDYFHDWYCINDTVMGGKSASQVEKLADGKLRWSGEVSLLNGGGFTSVRLALPATDLSSFDGICLYVKGDGHTYKLNLANDSGSAQPRFQARFDTTGAYQEVKIPFRQLEASVRGRSSAAHFDPSHLVQVGFLIADRQAGAFQLIVEKIEAYAD